MATVPNTTRSSSTRFRIPTGLPTITALRKLVDRASKKTEGSQDELERLLSRHEELRRPVADICRSIELRLIHVAVRKWGVRRGFIERSATRTRKFFGNEYDTPMEKFFVHRMVATDIEVRQFQFLVKAAKAAAGKSTIRLRKNQLSQAEEQFRAYAVELMLCRCRPGLHDFGRDSASPFPASPFKCPEDSIDEGAKELSPGLQTPTNLPLGFGGSMVEKILIEAVADKLDVPPGVIEEGVKGLRGTLYRDGDGTTEALYVHLIIARWLGDLGRMDASESERNDAAITELQFALERCRRQRLAGHQASPKSLTYGRDMRLLRTDPN